MFWNSQSLELMDKNEVQQVISLSTTGNVLTHRQIVTSRSSGSVEHLTPHPGSRGK